MGDIVKRESVKRELRRFEGPDGFAAPCELIVASGTA